MGRRHGEKKPRDCQVCRRDSQRTQAKASRATQGGRAKERRRSPQGGGSNGTTPGGWLFGCGLINTGVCFKVQTPILVSACMTWWHVQACTCSFVCIFVCVGGALWGSAVRHIRLAFASQLYAGFCGTNFPAANVPSTQIRHWKINQQSLDRVL